MAEVRELEAQETGLAWNAVHELRPQLVDQAAFVTLVNDVLRPGGYRLIGVFEDPEPSARAIAGFRVAHMIAWGRYLYVDDLATRADARRQGHGARLLEWLGAEAERQGCDSFHLDSGVGPQRSDAHRLYLNSGLRIGAHHFQREV